MDVNNIEKNMLTGINGQDSSPKLIATHSSFFKKQKFSHLPRVPEKYVPNFNNQNVDNSNGETFESGEKKDKDKAENEEAEEEEEEQNSVENQNSSKICKCCTPPQLPPTLVHILSWIYRHCSTLICYLIFFAIIYSLLWVFSDAEALPPVCHRYLRNHTLLQTKPVAFCTGGTTLTIVIFYALAFAFGEITELFRLPGLLGMLISGLLLRCISVFSTGYAILRAPLPPHVYLPANSTHPVILHDNLLKFAALLQVDTVLSSQLRQVALATILTRAGLGLNPRILRKVFTGVIRLAFIPCLTEAMAAMVASKFLLGWPWTWAAMLGFVLAAVSPAVVVPNMIRLEVAGYGVAHGIPTLIMAASSLDDVVAITGFGIALSVAFSSGNIIKTIFMGPIEVVCGATVGLCMGILLWFIPPPGMEHCNVLRGCIIISVSVVAIVGTVKMEVPGIGALACLVFSFVVSMGWQKGFPWSFLPPKQESSQSRKINLNSDPNRKTEHHDYYHQHLQMLKRLVGLDHQNVLGAVSKNRRFSLSEPKPDYELDEFTPEPLMDKDAQSSRGLNKSRSNVKETNKKWQNLKLNDEHQQANNQSTYSTGTVKQAEVRLNASPQTRGNECLKTIRNFVATLWYFVQPLLFCLIGADIPVDKLRPDVVGLGIAAVVIALVVRLLATVVAVTPSRLAIKERIFVAFAWMPKATVQAAIGPIALDTARKVGDPLLINYGEQILTLAALSILITAPLGATLMMLTAPYLLKHDTRLFEMLTGDDFDDSGAVDSHKAAGETNKQSSDTNSSHVNSL